MLVNTDVIYIDHIGSTIMNIWKIETEEAVVSIIPETQRETIDKISELLNAESSNEIGMSVKAYYIQVIH